MPAEAPYFTAFLSRRPPVLRPLGPKARMAWHLLAGLTVGLGVWYLHWRWTASLNPEALIFSIAVALAETLAFCGTLLFFFDIWDEGDTPRQPPPRTRADAGLEGAGDLTVDIFVTTYDEEIAVVAPTIAAARAVTAPPGVRLLVHLLDDGNRPEMAALAAEQGVGYLTRTDNRGYKAGNLASALFATDGDFLVICDADTQLFPDFVQNTLGYFRDPKVSWVQTPHWFYDIPEGQPWADWLSRRLGRFGPALAPLAQSLTGRARVAADPFLADPTMFFDVIQRRRNRHGASFCCGAGSIHRREAVFSAALTTLGQRLTAARKFLPHQPEADLLPRLDIQPFRYHVSEDIFTSILHHAQGWTSVYHPQVEARMLSPWSVKAWAAQKLKYAGGTFDIMLHANPLWMAGMSWARRLHYAATFASYIGALWMPVLFLAPVVSLITGIAAVEAYSLTFFLHLLPVLVMNELAMSIGAKGHDIHAGRILSIGTLTIQWRTLWQVARGRKPHFPPTPKTPMLADAWRLAMPNVLLLGLMACAAIWGGVAHALGSPGHSLSLLIVNLFWMGCNGLALLRVARLATWRPRLPDGALIPAE